jgi:tetrahydromethanopterin S-methyltransferase subunit B
MDIFVGLVKNPKEDTITISQNRGRKKVDDLDILVSNLTNSIQ